MSLLVGLEHQPNFPNEDLNESNAAMLEMLLQNLLFVEDGHRSTEDACWVYKVGHPAVMRVVRQVYEAEQSQHAVDHGVKLFESIVSIVSTPPERIAHFAAERTLIQLIHGKDSEELRNYSFDAVDDLREQLPVASETIRQAAQRQCGRLTEYALLGAAMSRQFSIDCSNATKM